VGTEIHLVNRMARRFAAQGKKVITLDDHGLPVHHHCTASARSTWPGFWRILVAGRVVNRIQSTGLTSSARGLGSRLDRMLEVK